MFNTSSITTSDLLTQRKVMYNICFCRSITIYAIPAQHGKIPKSCFVIWEVLQHLYNLFDILFNFVSTQYGGWPHSCLARSRFQLPCRPQGFSFHPSTLCAPSQARVHMDIGPRLFSLIVVDFKAQQGCQLKTLRQSQYKHIFLKLNKICCSIHLNPTLISYAYHQM